MIPRLRSYPSRLLAYLRWRVYWYLSHFFQGDHAWGAARLFMAVSAIGLFVVFGRMTEAVQLNPAVSETTSALPGIVEFVVGIFTRQGLRHALLPVGGFILAITIGAAFVNDLFELGDRQMAYDYLLGAVFGQGYPRLALRGRDVPAERLDVPPERPSSPEAEGAVARLAGPSSLTLGVKDGKPDPPDANSPLLKIGGPGYLNLGIGLAAVFQNIAAPSSVVGPGWHFVRRFETLREAFDLRDQFRTTPEVKAMTKDGIPVTVKDVQMSFRIRTGGRSRTETDPYPFSVSALRNAALNKTVGPNGVSPWADSAAGAIAGQIRAMIGRRRLDDLIAAESRDPREEMRDEFFQPATRKRYADMGAEILWVSLGHFETSSHVANQRIATWQARWQREAAVTEAEGEAEKLKLEEQARGEAVVDMLNRGIKMQSDSQTLALDLLLARLIEMLESYSRQSDLDFQSRREVLSLISNLRRLGGSRDPIQFGAGDYYP